MWSLRKPSAELIERFLDSQRSLPFSYSFVGATAAKPPVGFVVDRTHIRLGSGEAAFLAAKNALRRWDHFRLGWVEAWPGDTPIAAGEVVGIVARVAGTWWLNACRIVYVIDESGAGADPITRFGFAYGTLPDHIATGEERFLVEWDRAADCVSYEIVAVSRIRHPLAQLGYPVVRRVQRRFGRDSAAAVKRTVAERSSAS